MGAASVQTVGLRKNEYGPIDFNQTSDLQVGLQVGIESTGLNLTQNGERAHNKKLKL
jgi:hypothetical protein